MLLRDVLKITAFTSLGKGICFIDNKGEYWRSYSQMYEAAIKFGKWLKIHNINKGDSLIILIKNNEDYIISLWACFLYGYIAVPVDYILSPSDKLKIQAVKNISKSLPMARIITDTIQEALLMGTRDDGKVLLISEYKENQHSVEEELEELSAEDVVLILFTSGSTSAPKGIMLNSLNMISSMKQVVDRLNLNDEDVIIDWMPLTHAAGLILLHLIPIYSKSDEVILAPDFWLKYPKKFWQIVSKYEGSVTMFPNFAIEFMVEYGNDSVLSDCNLKKLRCVMNGAEPINCKNIQEFNNIYKDYGFNGNAMIAIYGMTEATTALTLHNPMKQEEKSYRTDKKRYFSGEGLHEGTDTEYIDLAYVGKPVAGVTFKIINESGIEAKGGEIGEIFVSGPNISNSFISAEGCDSLIDESGYLDTGDMGCFINGQLIITGRKKGVIFFNGLNFYPEDIENICKEALGNDKQECVACAITNELTLKDELVIFVEQGKMQKETVEAIKKAVSDTINQTVSYVLPVDEICKNRTGKKQRFKMKEQFEKGEFDYIIKNKNMNKKTAIKNNVDQVMEVLLRFWRDVLKKEVKVDDDFYKIGGNSLAMLQLIGKIQEMFGVEIEPGDFIEMSTIYRIATLIIGRNIQGSSKNSERNENTFLPSTVQEAYLIGRDDGYELGGISTHGYYEIDTSVNIETLNRSLNMMISYQPALRTVVLKNGYHEILDQVPFYTINCEDCSNVSKEVVERKISNIRSRLAQSVLNPYQWPLFKIEALTGINKENTYLFIHLDLLIMDGASIGIFMSQWKKLCNSEKNPIPGFNLLEHQVKRNDSEKYLRDKSYWLSQIDGFPLSPQLKIKKEIINIETTKSNRIQKVLDKNVYSQICQKAADYKVSPSMAFCMAYSYVLGFWSNQDKLAINVTTMDRPMLENSESIIGEFTSIVLLDVSYDAKASFWDNCQKIQENLLNGLNHRAYDGIEFIREIMKKSDIQTGVVMPVVYTSMLFQNNDITIDALGEMKYAISQTSQVYLDSQVSETKNGILFNWDYMEDLFEEYVIEEMFDQYIKLIESLAGKETSLPVLSRNEQEKIIKYNQTFEDIPDMAIQNVFKKVALRFPDKVICTDVDGYLRCDELDKKSAQIANFLLDNGIGKGDVIALKGERNIAAIINILGILKSGAAYVAIDPEFPQDRQSYIIKHSNSRLYLDSQSYKAKEIYKYSDTNPNVDYMAGDLAYVIYTSGSTGTPKGVAISQGAVMNTVLDINRKFNVTEDDKIIALSSMCFDLSVYDIFASFSTGAMLVEVPDVHDVYNLAKIIRDEGITIWNSAPAIMEMLLDNIVIEESDFYNLDANEQIRVNISVPNLRLVLLSGDWIPVSLPARIKEEYNKAEVISLGGATEASIWSIYYPIREVNPEWKSIPYGTPLANQAYYVLNFNQEICPIGVQGELYIGGKGLAEGYYHDIEKTESAFIRHPRYGRLYRTGDYGIMTADGYIVFQGRKDQQIKLSGHRIELGEIEKCIMQYDTVKNCVVVDWEDSGKRYLCAYIVMDGYAGWEQLRSFLKTTLPEYMIPMYFEKISEIPLNVNGKVDRKALRKPRCKTDMMKDKVLPRTITEKKLYEIWRNVLDVQDVSIKEQFMKLGGDSIKMVNVLGKISDYFHAQISFKEFMTANTIEKLAILLGKKTESLKDESIYPHKEHDIANEDEAFPLTDVQMAYLIGRNDGLDLGGISTHGYYEIQTQLDMKKLEVSLNDVIQTQPMLRAIIEKSGTQKILKHVPEYKIRVFDLSKSSKEEQKRLISDERNRMSHHIFQTDKWPLFEFKAYKIEEGEYYLFIGIDLLIADGGSIRIFINELLDSYYGWHNKNEKSAFTYKDYIEALEEFKNSDTYTQDKIFWEKQIEKIPPAPALPLNRKTLEVVNPHFARCEKILEYTEWNAIKDKAKKMGVTVSSLLCTAYAMVLGFWSNQPKLTLNVTVFTRYPFNENVKTMIGDFTSVILLSIDLTEKFDFWRLAVKVQMKLIDALEHRHYDGMNVIRKIAQVSDMQQQAVMPVVFTSLLFSMNKVNNASISDLGEIKKGISQTSQVYLDYQVMETKEGLSITWDYIEELFDSSMMPAMFCQYIDILRKAAKNTNIWPQNSIEDKAILVSYNDTGCDIKESTIQQEFSHIVSKYPGKCLIKDMQGEVSCKEVDQKSSQIANCLMQKGVNKGDVIAIHADRQKETIINILGILKAGAAYVAIEPEYPEERQKYILENSKSKMYLYPSFYYDEDVETYCDRVENVIYNTTDLAYIIYTSGSTGLPKGVAITQGAVMNTVLDINRKFHVTEKDRIIGLSSMCFDLSVYDIFGSLSSGATLIEISDIHDVYNLSKVVHQEGITIWNSVPAIMEMMLDNTTSGVESEFWEIDENAQLDIDVIDKSLRLVLLSGDWIPVNLPERIKREFEDTEIISLGGATEASIWSIYYPIREVNPKWKSIPYGSPLSNQTYYILNYWMEDCPVGVQGELYIGGKGLAVGYYGDIEKTEATFIQHPRYGRLYKTGDYGVMTTEGYIVFQGRKDQQVKISGHRIELGEIENILMQHEMIKNCIVVDWDEPGNKKYLCAYIVTKGSVEEDELYSHLRDRLPEYMIPKYIENINEIPLNTNGKVDRKKLHKPNRTTNDNNEIVLPRTQTEKTLVAIWREVLGINVVGIKDSFMSLGGDSIKMVRVMNCISEQLNTNVSYKEFLLSNTPEKLACLIDQQKGTGKGVKYSHYEHDQSNQYDKFPLTDVQMAYLIGRNEEFDLGGVSTHGYYEVLTELNIKKIERGLNASIREQPMLRTVFSQDGTQRILKNVPVYKIEVEDLTDCTIEEQENKILEERSRMSHHVFSTDKWPLFEFKAFKINDKKYYLFIGIDLLVADGSSMRILVKDLRRGYVEKSDNGELFNYKDYVRALEEFKNSKTYVIDKKYWLEQIDLIPPSPDLPLKCELSSIKNPHFKRYHALIDTNKWHKIKQMARNKEITLSALLCSIYALVLGYWSNQPELTINVTVFTRYPFNENVKNIIGDFTSVVLLKVSLGDFNNFWGFADSVQKQMMEILEHRHYDGINVIREIAKRRSMQQQAVMPVVFTSLLFSMDNEDNTTINDIGEIKMGVSQTSQVYLDYQVMETKDGLLVTWDYIVELFEEKMIQSMFQQYIDLLENLEVPLEKVLEIDKSDKKLIRKYNDTKQLIHKTTLQSEFKKIVLKYPYTTIVSDKDGEITCKDLDVKSNQVANYLIRQGVVKGDIVGVLGERKRETIINILGILKAGAAYVALDPEYPLERQEYILAHSESRYLLKANFYESNNLKLYSTTEPVVQYTPEDIAYIIYTSGSTGVPKGVVIKQESVMNTVLDINHRFKINSSDKIIGLSSMCFDLSVYDIFGSLSTGAELVEIENLQDIKDVRRTVKEKGITIWNSVPAVMEIFTCGLKADDTFPTLKKVLLSGDWIPVDLPEQIKRSCHNAQIISLGGATEGSIWSIYHPIERVEPEWKSIPYGKPLTNQTFYVLNYAMRNCPIGVRGELYIGGKGVAAGYYKDEEKTKAAFIEHPEYGRLYRTGDYGVMSPNGFIIFLGRKDHQVKIGGHRIELGEIEHHLLQHEAVKNCVVIDCVDELDKKYLCGYFVSDENIESSELQNILRDKLPNYMVPRTFLRIGEIPLTANGKVNRGELPKPNYKNAKTGKCVEARTVKQKEVLKIWEEVLNTSNISIFDDFFEIGGDSISAMKVYSALTQKYQISIKELYLYRDIESLSRMLRKKEPEKYFEFLKNQYEKMEKALRNPTEDYMQNYLAYLKDTKEKYENIDLDVEEKYRNIFFVGATGFLGSHIIYEFLSKSNVDIYALTRATNLDEARKRVKDTLKFFDKYKKEWDLRIHIMVGDASKHNFGLSDYDYKILLDKVDCVFNCAAIVSHLGLYETMYNSNVMSCKNILKFAENKKGIKVFHISTKHVGFGEVKGKSRVLFTENEFDVGQVIDNNYAKTKFEAEELMRSARMRGLDVSLFRMGNISCEMESGSFQRNMDQNAFYILMRSFIRLGIIPQSNLKTVDLTYVDCAASAIYLLSTRKELRNETYHIENTELLSFTRMGEMIKQVGENISLESYDAMWNCFEQIYVADDDRAKVTEINNLIAYIDFLPWHTPTLFSFVKDKTKYILNKLEFKWREPDEIVIKHLIDYGKQVGFFD